MNDRNHKMIIENIDGEGFQVLQCLDCSRKVKRKKKSIFEMNIKSFFANDGWYYDILDYGESNIVHWVRDSE